jgi:hypothetical protein
MTGHQPQPPRGHRHGSAPEPSSWHRLPWRWSGARPERDRGSAAIEAAVLAPAMLVLIGVAIVGGRIQVSGGAIETAAHDAARAASISRTADQARTVAYAAAEATLTQAGLHCARLVVVVDTSGFVEAEALYEHPFTSHAPRGPEDFFPEPDVDAMVAVLNRVRANAIAIDHVA